MGLLEMQAETSLSSETAFLDRLKAAPTRVEDTAGNVLDAGSVTLTRKWDGQSARLILAVPHKPKSLGSKSAP